MVSTKPIFFLAIAIIVIVPNVENVNVGEYLRSRQNLGMWWPWADYILWGPHCPK